MQSRPPSSQMPGLDGLRGLAILLVVLWHSAVRTQFPPDALGPLRGIVLMGWSGVDLFFAISGFLITRLMLAEEVATGAVDLRRFYARRALRILPAFYLVLAVDLFVLPRFALFTTARSAHTPTLLELLSLSTYWSNYFYGLGRRDAAPALSIFWSLCVEEHFYLIWPLLLRAVRGRNARTRLALAVCGAVAALRLLSLGSQPPAVIHLLSHDRVDSILWGAVAAFALEWLRAHPALRRGGLILLALGAALIYAPNPLGTHPVATVLGLTALAALSAALVAEIAAAPRGLLARLFSFSPLAALGWISYGVYLIHYPVLDVAARHVVPRLQAASPAGFVALATAGLAYSAAAGSLLYWVWEKPFLRLKERFVPPRAPMWPVGVPPAPVAAAVSTQVC